MDNVDRVVSVNNHRVWGARSCFQVAAPLAWWHGLWLLRCQCGLKRALYAMCKAVFEKSSDVLNELLACDDCDCCNLETGKMHSLDLEAENAESEWALEVTAANQALCRSSRAGKLLQSRIECLTSKGYDKRAKPAMVPRHFVPTTAATRAPLPRPASHILLLLTSNLLVLISEKWKICLTMIAISHMWFFRCGMQKMCIAIQPQSL